MAEKRSRESKIKGNSLGASGFTLGIVALVSLAWFGLVASLVGFFLCFFQQKKRATKLGKIGMILNLIGFVLSIVWIVWIGPVLNELLSLNAAGI